MAAVDHFAFSHVPSPTTYESYWGSLISSNIRHKKSDTKRNTTKEKKNPKIADCPIPPRLPYPFISNEADPDPFSTSNSHHSSVSWATGVSSSEALGALAPRSLRGGLGERACMFILSCCMRPGVPWLQRLGRISGFYLPDPVQHPPTQPQNPAVKVGLPLLLPDPPIPLERG